MNVVGGTEEERAVHVGQVRGEVQSIGLGINVLDHERAGGGAIAFPKLKAVRPVVRSEEENHAQIRPIVWIGASRTGTDVLDKKRAGGGAVSGPEFGAVYAVVSGEEDCGAYNRELTGI